MRDHEAIKITEFNGLWRRGDAESTPIDHFSDCKNLTFIESGFQTRPGITQFSINPALCVNLSNVRRIYTYLRPDRQSMLVLDDAGNIFDTGSPTPCTAILTIATMTDFAMVSISGLAYISPHDGVSGLSGEFVYVYLGDGNPARVAAGLAPSVGPMVAMNGGAGDIEAGYHVFGCMYETNTGFITAIGIPTLVSFLSPGSIDIDLSNIPISADPNVVARRIVATKAIDPSLWTGNLEGYEFFFVDRIPNNTATTLTVSFFDAELLESASEYFDFFDEIPAGVFLTTYHNRLVVGGIFGTDNVDPTLDTSANRGTFYVSLAGQPEAINEIDGVLVPPLDGNPLTTAQEYRDVFYVFKNTRTYSYNDNGDVPSSWPVTILDQGYGASVHGIAFVLDSGGISADYLIIANYNGICLFNGGFIKPELTWKIEDYWLNLDRTLFLEIQILNDTIGKNIYASLPNFALLYGSYDEGLTPKDMKWCPWEFNLQVTTITLINTNNLIIGSLGVVP